MKQRLAFLLVSAAGAVASISDARGAVLQATVYGYTNIAPINQVTPTSNTTLNTGTIVVDDSNTGEAAGLATGNVAGVITSGSHACGEPPRVGGKESDNAGYGSIQYQDQFQIRSTTLPLNTPVTIEICVVTAFHHQEGDDLHNSQTDTTVDAKFRANNSVDTGSDVGDFSYVNNSFGARMTTTGNLFGSEREYTLHFAVGQSFGILASLVCDSTASVTPGEVGDVQAQAAMVFGGESETAGVTLISNTTGNPLPDMTNCTLGYAESAVPPPLIDFDTPEPGLLSVVVAATAVMVRRRRV